MKSRFIVAIERPEGLSAWISFRAKVQRLSIAGVEAPMCSRIFRPSRKWLSIAKTHRAKDKIRRFLREQERAQSLEIGTRLVEAELRKHNVNPRPYLKSKELLEIAQQLQFESIEELLVQVGFGKISERHLVNRLFPEPDDAKDEETSLEEIEKMSS